jgi:hypothetical protein
VFNIVENIVLIFVFCAAAWRTTMESHRQWFLDQENVKSIENNRPTGAIDFDSYFGVQRSFKKLSID